MISSNTLSSIANTSAAAGISGGTWAFLSNNSSAITSICVIITLMISILAFFANNRIRNRANDINNMRSESDAKRADIELRRFDMEERLAMIETRKLELANELKSKEIELMSQ